MESNNERTSSCRYTYIPAITRSLQIIRKIHSPRAKETNPSVKLSMFNLVDNNHINNSLMFVHARLCESCSVDPKRPRGRLPSSSTPSPPSSSQCGLNCNTLQRTQVAKYIHQYIYIIYPILYIRGSVKII